MFSDFDSNERVTCVAFIVVFAGVEHCVLCFQILIPILPVLHLLMCFEPLCVVFSDPDSHKSVACIAFIDVF
jgi:hypothetical protein